MDPSRVLVNRFDNLLKLCSLSQHFRGSWDCRAKRIGPIPLARCARDTYQPYNGTEAKQTSLSGTKRIRHPLSSAGVGVQEFAQFRLNAPDSSLIQIDFWHLVGFLATGTIKHQVSTAILVWTTDLIIVT